VDDTEKAIRERELIIKERELDLKMAEHRRMRLNTPVILALIAAFTGLLSNAFVSWYNAGEQRALEERRFTEGARLQEIRSQQERIVEFLKTNNTDKATDNLNFAVQVGIISEPAIREGLKAYLATAQPGKGPALIAGWGNTKVAGGVYTSDPSVEYNYNYTMKRKPRAVKP